MCISPMMENASPLAESRGSRPFMGDFEEATAISAGGRGTKRRRINTLSDSFTRRKRSSTACHFCRLRKTKCDNVKPVCGFCRDNGAVCVYSDTEAIPGDYTRTNDSGATCLQETKSGNEEIIARLDEIKRLLLRPGSTGLDLPFQLAVTPSTPVVQQTPHTQYTAPHTKDRGLEAGIDSLNDHRFPHPYAAARCEKLLSWPIFDGLISTEHAAIESFICDTQHEFVDDEEDLDESDSSPDFRPECVNSWHTAHRSAHATTFQGRGISDDAFVPLCSKFLAHVYPRNPILKADELMQYAKAAAENGLSWDAPSCLVLVVCALASYTMPWERPPFDPQGESAPSPFEADSVNKATAEAYFTAAKKRIGLLGSSLVDIQCLFMASIYEKYAFRPLQSWFYLQQAANRLQVRHWGKIHTQSARVMNKGRRSNRASAYQISQRLFWSCYKAETELMPELGLRPSCLEDLSEHDTLPAPPEILAQDDGSGFSPSTDDTHSADKEPGWFFYLAEISLRRTINDTISLLYRKTEKEWLNHPGHILRQCTEAKRQIGLCYDYLPLIIRFQETEPAANEFSFYLQARFGEWTDLVLRPLIYYTIHTTHNQIHPEIINLAQQGIDGCATAIQRNFSHHHRHGGTWFVTRRMFSGALTILAAVVCDRHALPPTDWPSLIMLAHSFLARWSGESCDVERMRQVLEDVFYRVCNKTGFDKSRLRG